MRSAGVKRAIGLGSINMFTLAEARERARKARQLVAGGIDPIDPRAATRTPAAVRQPTVMECAERYIAEPIAGMDALEIRRCAVCGETASYGFGPRGASGAAEGCYRAGHQEEGEQGWAARYRPRGSFGG